MVLDESQQYAERQRTQYMKTNHNQGLKFLCALLGLVMIYIKLDEKLYCKCKIFIYPQKKNPKSIKVYNNKGFHFDVLKTSCKLKLLMKFVYIGDPV